MPEEHRHAAGEDIVVQVRPPHAIDVRNPRLLTVGKQEHRQVRRYTLQRPGQRTVIAAAIMADHNPAGVMRQQQGLGLHEIARDQHLEIGAAELVNESGVKMGLVTYKQQGQSGTHSQTFLGQIELWTTPRVYSLAEIPCDGQQGLQRQLIAKDIQASRYLRQARNAGQFWVRRCGQCRNLAGTLRGSSESGSRIARGFVRGQTG